MCVVHLPIDTGFQQEVRQPPDIALLENPPTDEELTESVMAIEFLVPEPTATGIGIAVLVSLAAGYFGIRA